MIVLHNFPMSPSSNNMYATIMRGRKPCRIKSKELREFEKDAANWALAGGINLMHARQLAKQCKPGLFLEVHAKFYFKPERILCKDGRPKRNDTSNRVKALHDMLAQILGIDDCWFWSGSIDKMFIIGNVPEHVLIQVNHRKFDSPVTA